MANDLKMLVFAYGSNMCTQRMRSRVSTARPVQIGYVSQRKLEFRKRSVDGSAKADAASTASPNDRVWGVVYELHQHQKPVLDQHEFLGVGYDEEVVDVVHENGMVRAWIYVARRSAIDPSLLPYSWYHDFMIHGACQHRLPDHYVDHLRTFDSLLDPNAERHSENQRIIFE
jgi:gamma-glutamylcyclotransferase